MINVLACMHAGKGSSHLPVFRFGEVIDLELIGIRQPSHGCPCLLPIGGVEMKSQPLIHIE